MDSAGKNFFKPGKVSQGAVRKEKSSDTLDAPSVYHQQGAGRDFFEKRYAKLGGEVIQRVLPQVLRVNTLKITAKELIPRLEKKGVQLKRIPFTRNGFEVVKSPFSLGAITESLLGYYYIQEAAAQIPVEVLDPKPNEVVLDCCAAPGGKTTQAAAAMENQGTLIAFDLKEHRIPSLLMNLERCGVKNTTVFQSDSVQAGKLGLKFDKILLDAPCSGNFLSEPGWFEKRDAQGIESSVNIQRRLLKSAVEFLAPGGILVYSICSLEPEEGELNMQWAIDHLPVKLAKVSLQLGDPGLTTVFGQTLSPDITNCRRFWPHKTNTQGFFIAKLVKV